METLKAYVLDFAKGLIAALVAAAIAYIADADPGQVILAALAGGGFTAAGPRDRQRRKR